MVQITVDATELSFRLRRLETRGYNMDEVNAQISQILHLMVEDKFEDEGPGWPELDESTLRRRKESTSPKMLQDTTDMVNSLQPASGPDFSEVFTNKEYARYHIEGEGVPKRDFFDIDIKKALDQAQDILSEALTRSRR